jgi:lipoate synthase
MGTAVAGTGERTESVLCVLAGVAAVNLVVIGRFARPTKEGLCATMRFKDP